MRCFPLRGSASLRAGLYVTLAAVVGAACGRDQPPPRVDSVSSVPPVVRPESAVAPPLAERVTWDDSSAGPALFVAADTAQPGVASAVLPAVAASLPDSAVAAAVSALNGVTVDLFTLGGKAGTATIADGARAVVDDPDACAPWPAVRLNASGGSRRAWTVGFSAGHATPIPIDSIEGLSSVDSAARTAEVARLASLVPRTSAKEFAGLPFAVRQARHFTTSGVDVLVAEAVRKIGQEANPREQHVLVVAERPAGGTGKYDLAYNETSAGDETKVETRDVLAAVALGADRRTTLVLNREYEDALAYSLLERTGEKRWRVRWTSAKLGCSGTA